LLPHSTLALQIVTAPNAANPLRGADSSISFAGYASYSTRAPRTSTLAITLPPATNYRIEINRRWPAEPPSLWKRRKIPPLPHPFLVGIQMRID
jgi:hypothetical protein